MEKDLKIIKKKYGEKFAQYCRDSFPTILEKEGALVELIEKTIAPTHSIYADLEENDLFNRFKNYIYGLFSKEDLPQKDIEETPEELMDKAGYTLYKCETDEDVKSFMKYYRSDEKLCTFRDPDRIKSHTIFFAVKKDVNKIKREDFKNPRRQDEYGTSVISLQFTKEKNQLSIKNRYNHTVENPDATFSNDLDNIIAGLTDSFEKYYGLKQTLGKQTLEIPNYVRGNDGRYYRYNYEINNVYYCENNIIVDGNREVEQLDKSRYELIDYYILDKKAILDKNEKRIVTFVKDSFVDLFKDVKKVEIKNLDDKKGRKFIITNNDGTFFEFEVNEHNEITTLYAPELKVIGDSFLQKNKFLTAVSLPRLERMGGGCFCVNESITKLSLPQLRTMGVSCFEYNTTLTSVSLPKLELMEDCCFSNNRTLTEISLPKLEWMGDCCFQYNTTLTSVSLPKLQMMGENCFYFNESLTELSFPKLESMGIKCFSFNKSIRELSLPRLKMMGGRCFRDNKSITKLSLPRLLTMGDGCFYCNKFITKLSLPQLQIMGDSCFEYTSLTLVSLPKLELMGDSCFEYNTTLTEVSLPQLRTMGRGCFEYNTTLTKVSLPRLKGMESFCFSKNKSLRELSLPKLHTMGDSCFENNTTLTEVSLPQLQKMGYSCFENNEYIKKIAEKIVRKIERIT